MAISAGSSKIQGVSPGKSSIGKTARIVRMIGSFNFASNFVVITDFVLFLPIDGGPIRSFAPAAAEESHGEPGDGKGGHQQGCPQRCAGLATGAEENPAGGINQQKRESDAERGGV